MKFKNLIFLIKSYIEEIPKKYLFLALGVIFSIGSPLGWQFVYNFMSFKNFDIALNLYLFISTAIFFGSFGFVLGGSHDILYSLLDNDHLTVLYNQKAFIKYTKNYYSMGIRHKDNMAIIMLDIDDFKNVNDNHHHLAGSYILKEVAKIIKNNIRASDFAGRFGGDEFVICLPRISYESSIKVGERIRNFIEQTTFNFQENDIHITISLGLAFSNCHQIASVEGIIGQADFWLYEAKKSGKNKLVAKNLTY